MMTDHVPLYQTYLYLPCNIISKSTSIIHTQSRILVLGLGWGLMLFHDDWPCTVKSKHTSTIHTQSRILVLGLGLGHVFFHDDWPCNIISKPTSIIHTQSRILVLGLGTGHMLFHDDRPYTITSKHTSKLKHAYWYWALVWALCCFMMTDHVISHVYTPIPNIQ